MEKRSDTLNNYVTPQGEDSSSDKQRFSFNKFYGSDPPKNHKEKLSTRDMKFKLLDYIRANAPIKNLYKLWEKVGIPKSSFYTWLKDFQYLGLIEIRTILNENNREVKLITISDARPWRLEND